MRTARRILLHLGGGMGDMLLATPMMEMLGRGGYVTDLCLQGDTGGVEALFDGWPYVRAVSRDPARFVANEYEYYIYGDDVSGGPIPFKNRDAAIRLHPLWDWRRGHELYSETEMYVDIARAIDPDLPVVTRPSCAASARVFPDISASTCVLAPGGQRNLIIRKWPKFAQLAERLPDVAVIGTRPDLDLANRVVFPDWARRMLGSRLDRRGRTWRLARHFADRHDAATVFPPHVKNHLGQLSLADTAALIRQAGVVVGNDCGLTHLAVALGKPVVVLLGPSSRRRVYPPMWTNVRVVSKRYECQPCQEKTGSARVWRQSMGQCFCPYRLRCMNDIDVDEVLEAIAAARGDSPA